MSQHDNKAVGLGYVNAFRAIWIAAILALVFLAATGYGHSTMNPLLSRWVFSS